MSQVQCGSCNVVFVLPKGQIHPKKCGSCGVTGKMLAIAKTWNCQRCGTLNGKGKASCQGCKVERHTQQTDKASGKRAKPDDNLHTIAYKPMRSRIIKSIISDGD